jgi:hypothetical protein
MWNRKRDEGRSLGAGDQEQAPNHCELLALRALVVSVAGKGGKKSCQVRSGKTSASKPLMRCRNSQNDVETGGKVVAPGMSSGGALESGPSGIRLGGGVNPDQALLWNAGTCRSAVKGEAHPKKGKRPPNRSSEGLRLSRPKRSLVNRNRTRAHHGPKHPCNIVHPTVLDCGDELRSGLTLFARQHVALVTKGAYGPEGKGRGNRRSNLARHRPCHMRPRSARSQSAFRTLDLYYLYRWSAVCGVQRRVKTGIVNLCFDSTPTRFRHISLSYAL